MRRPFTSFCFCFWKFCFGSCLCLSRGMEVAACYSRHSPLQVGVGVRRDRRECRESTGREPSCPPFVGDICRRRWLSQACGWFPGCLVPGLPLPQARRSREITPPARLWLNARRPASDSMPARSPLTHARRIAVDSCPPAAAIPSPVDQVHMLWPGVPFLSRVVPTGTFKFLVLSCPRRLVEGRRLL